MADDAHTPLPSSVAGQRAKHFQEVPSGPVREDLMLTIESFEVHRISSIDETASTFGAQVYVRAVFKDGANKHPELAENLKAADFPMHPEGHKLAGKPTWKPNARWYLERLVFDNMCIPPSQQLIQRDHEARIEGNDVVLTIYTEGLFYECFELWDFPFDAQDLTFTLALNATVDGPVGCALARADNVHSVISVKGMLLKHRWFNAQYLDDEMKASDANESCGIVDSAGDNTRVFPCVFFNIKLCRCCSYHVVNIIMPLTGIVLIGFLQFTMEPDDSTRIEVSLGLVMVCVLFKFSVMSPDHTPTVAYSTVLDQYMVACNFVIFLMATENGFVRLIANNEVWYDNVCDTAEDIWLDFWDGYNTTRGTPRASDGAYRRLTCALQIDFVCFVVILGIFFLVVGCFSLYFIYVRQKGSHLENVRKKASDLNIKPLRELGMHRAASMARPELNGASRYDSSDLAKVGAMNSGSVKSDSSRASRENSATSPVRTFSAVRNNTTPIPAASLNVVSASASNQPANPVDIEPTFPPAATNPPAAPKSLTAPNPLGRQVSNALINELKNAEELTAPPAAPSWAP